MSEQASFKPDFVLETTVPVDGTGLRIEVRGELDSGTCGELWEAFQAALARGAKEVTLDLRQMTFIDSAGTRMLIMIERSASEGGLSLVVTPPPEQVTELLRTAGVVGRVELDSQVVSGPSAESGLIERIELELPREPHSPARARSEVRESVGGAEQPQLANVVLLTSELVTNAVVHPRRIGQSPIGLRVIVYQQGVRVEVEDAGQGFERVAPISPEAERGRGLFLVDRFSDRWGSGRVQTDAGERFRVWFEIDWREQEDVAVA